MTEPLPQHLVPFYDDTLMAVQRPDGIIFVSFTRLCENIGLSRQSQARRIQGHTVLNEGFITLTVETEGGPQAIYCLRLDLVTLWLATVQAAKAKLEVQQKLVRYQREAAVVLWQAFQNQIVTKDTIQPPQTSTAIQELQHIAEMARAIAQLAEQQIELQREQQSFRHEVSERLMRAGHVVKGMRLDIADLQIRLGDVEALVRPGAPISKVQAAEVSQRVKALAELLTSKERGKNFYQGIFGELYRRFGVSSYTDIPQEQYTEVLAFLDDWKHAAHQGSTTPPGSASNKDNSAGNQ
jgi:hypothetical protein